MQVGFLIATIPGYQASLIDCSCHHRKNRKKRVRSGLSSGNDNHKIHHMYKIHMYFSMGKPEENIFKIGLGYFDVLDIDITKFL